MHFFLVVQYQKCSSIDNCKTISKICFSKHFILKCTGIGYKFHETEIEF